MRLLKSESAVLNMITKDKLALNLRDLKNKMPLKPKVYTQTHPRTIKEALIYYCNKTTVHTVQACTKNLSDENWPLPFWFNPEQVKVGFWNKVYYKRYCSWNKGRILRDLKILSSFWFLY